MTGPISGCLSLSLSLATALPVAAGGPGAGADAELSDRFAEQLRLVHAETGEPFPVGERPLLRYDDPDRGIRTGALRSWGRDGRPVAVAELYQKFDEPGEWHLAISSVGGVPLRGDVADSATWSPPSDPPRFDAVECAPRPHASAEVRVRQMKAIAQAFSAYEVFDPDRRRSQLRLLPNPLLRYVDPASSLTDGGLFVLSIGTNPEILLLIEAQGETWRFAAVRRGYAEMHLLLDGREVWRCDRLWETRPDEAMYEVVTDRPDAPR